jgi:hypothetical protein
VLRAEDTWFTTWRLAPILRPKVRDKIRERRESSSSREVADGGSAIAKTRVGLFNLLDIKLCVILVLALLQLVSSCCDYVTC